MTVTEREGSELFVSFLTGSDIRDGSHSQPERVSRLFPLHSNAEAYFRPSPGTTYVPGQSPTTQSLTRNGLAYASLHLVNFHYTKLEGDWSLAFLACSLNLGGCRIAARNISPSPAPWDCGLEGYRERTDIQAVNCRPVNKEEEHTPR